MINHIVKNTCRCEDQLLKTDKDFEENVKKATAYEKEKDSLSHQLVSNKCVYVHVSVCTRVYV